MASVFYPPDVLSRLHRWAEVAIRVGQREAFTAALREMDEQLRTTPESWGDPTNEFHAMKLTLYRSYGPVLIVSYAVRQEGTPVFVRSVRLTPGSLLADLLG